MSSEAPADTLPHWQLESIFPGLESKQFEAAFSKVTEQIGQLKDLFASPALGAGSRDPGIAPHLLEDILDRLNRLQENLITVGAYVYALVTTDVRNEAAQIKQSELQTHQVELTKVMNRFLSWVGQIDFEHAIERSTVAGDHAFMLRRAAAHAKHLMAQAEEDLAASLNVSGIEAWAKLHGRVTGLLTAEVQMPSGDRETLPMSVVRALAHDTEAAVRQAAYTAEIAAWQGVEVPLAAALNGIKGAVNVLNKARGWASSLQPSLFDNNTDIQTLEAMQEAVVESLPDFRRYLKAKAGLISGGKKLPWWDLYAPVTGKRDTRRWSYSSAQDFIGEHFASYSDRLAALAKRAFAEGWVDAEPREGKQQGGYCMTIRKDESRVFVNFEPSFDALQTLAHELGHAYHHHVIGRRPPLQRTTPMALAETASTFCQTIVFNAALNDAFGPERLEMLESSLSDACTYAVDIHSRFIFEKALFERSSQRELSIEELKSLMVQAQSQTYGDALDEATLHPYMWAGKVHYYLPDMSYYNWPYTFGMLFSLALYGRYLEDPAGFIPRYDSLLADTGVATPAELAGRFGMDVHSVDFWRSSLDVCRSRIDQFEKAAAAQRK